MGYKAATLDVEEYNEKNELIGHSRWVMSGDHRLRVYSKDKIASITIEQLRELLAAWNSTQHDD